MAQDEDPVKVDEVESMKNDLMLIVNRKLVLTKINMFGSIVNCKVEKCHKNKKIEDVLYFLARLGEIYNEFYEKVKSNEITHLEEPNKSYIAEMLKITKYENESEKVSKSTFKVIEDISKVLRATIMMKVGLLDSIKKIELSVTWVEIKIIEILEFMQE